MIRVGPAGWSYDDWNGIVYPSNPSSRFDRLAWIADYFETVEVNTSFYHIPDPQIARSWVRRINRPEFRFTVKLHRSFTHERSYNRQSIAAFHAFLDPIQSADRLGALLVQYPWSVRFGDDSLAAMQEIFNSFRDLPIAVEVRHSSFDVPAFREFLGGQDVAIVNLDQPSHRDAMPAHGFETADDIGYVRFHGRNLEKWFEHDEPWERYDYLYSSSEIEPWVERVRTMKSKDVFVIMNNHFRGQAVVNALEMKRELGVPFEVPPPLANQYPDRFELPRGAQTSLFPPRD